MNRQSECSSPEAKKAFMEWAMDEDQDWSEDQRCAFEEGRKSFMGHRSDPDPSKFPDDSHPHFWAGFGQGESEWFEQKNRQQQMEE